MQQFDFKLSKVDFDGVQWETDLASAKEPTCFEFCGLLKEKLDEAKATAQKSREQVYTLLHAACSLALQLADRKQPFRPAVIFEAMRSATIEDFAASDTTVLGDIATAIKDPEVRARVCDLLWVACRDFRMAKAAIPAYVESAKRLEGFPRSRVFVERLRRAAQLTWMVAKNDAGLIKVVTGEVARAISTRVATEEQWTCVDLMRVLLEVESGDAMKFAGDCELIAAKAEAKSAWSVARVYWQCKADWHRLANQPDEHRLALIRAAETYVGEGESALKRPTPSHGACVGNLQRAVEALRRIPDTKERVEGLHLRILKEQELSMGETTTHTFQTDISGMVKATVAMFKGKPKNEVLIGLAIFGAWPDKEELRTSAQEIAKESVWSQIVPTVFTTGKGKHIAEKPGGIFQNEDEQALSLKAQMMEQAKWHRGLMVDGGIKPALHVINSDHFVLREDLLFLVENNPFVPPGQEGIFLRGLHAGITGDFLVATHLLIPQIENSIRYLLANYAGEPRTSKLRHDLSQPERDLNELLYHEEVEKVLGPDLTFTLRALLIEPGFGANLRNNFAHGLMSTDQFTDTDAIYAWWAIWRICCLPHLMRLQVEAATMDQAQSGAPDAAKDHPKHKIGILAFGSLIGDPGPEIEKKIIMRIKTPTPFKVEYGRYSGTRGGAPTLVPHHDGAVVEAEILVLDDAVSVDEARNMLWRRERRKEGTGEVYVEGKTANSVLVREWAGSPCVESVLYTDFNPEGKVAKPDGGELAQKAIQSVKTANEGMDGISYLMNNIASGIKTQVSADYEAEILKQSGTCSLGDALRKAKAV